MRITDLLPTSARIIEIGAACGSLASQFVSAGYARYLAVAPDDRRRCEIAKQFPALQHRVATSASPDVVRQNNADVLILSGRAALQLWRFRSLRHARFILVPLAPAPSCCLALLFGVVQCLLRRFTWPCVVHGGPAGRARRFVAFRVRRPRPYDAVRRFIPHAMGVEGFLRRLHAAGLRHAVLRWFETLPQVSPGEDLDLLVDDAALESVRALLDEGPGIQAVDVYSVSGLPGADFRRMPYFPPYLAEELLDRAIVHGQLCRVPAAREHFLSLAYHALYHKGTASSIAHRGHQPPRPRRSDHDYPAVLRQIAERLGIELPITLEDLDAYLDSQGWRPPHDMLVRLSRRNRWIHSLLRHPEHGSAVDDRVSVFLIRQEALHRGGVARARQLIEEHGFQILATRELEGSAVSLVARSIRGGNWSRGPWPVSGGPPVAAVIAYDPAPIAPTRKQRRRFPFLANARLLCKEQIRDAFNEGLSADQHCNVIHSSDNGRETLDYLRIIAPDAVNELLSGTASLPPRVRRPAA